MATKRPEKTAVYVTKLADRAANSLKLPPTVSPADAVQDAVVAVLEWWDTWNPRVYAADFEPWMVMKARGILRDKYGKLWRDHYREHPSERPTVAPVDDTSADVQAAIDKLPAKQAVAIRLSMENYTQTEIAEKLGCTQPHVCNLLRKAKDALKATLEDYA